MRRLGPRQQTGVSFSPNTCGFASGDPNQPRTADPGFNCRTDTVNRLWGFCPVTVIAAADCGLAGNCVDSHGCQSGCGIFGTSGITTFTCSETGKEFCSTAVLTLGNAQDFETYNYIACGVQAQVDHLLPTTTTSYTFIESSSTPTTVAVPSTTIPPATSSTLPSVTETRQQVSQSQSLPSTTIFSSSPSSSLLTSPAAATSPPKPPSSNNTKIIVGGVIGGIAILVFLILGIFFLRRFKRVSNTTAVPARATDSDKYVTNVGHGKSHPERNDFVYNQNDMRKDRPIELHDEYSQTWRTQAIELPSREHAR